MHSRNRRRGARRYHAPRRDSRERGIASESIATEPRIEAIDSDWFIKSNRSTKDHTLQFAYLMRAEVESTPDDLVLDGVRNAISEGQLGSMSESVTAVPAGEIGPEPAEVARVMFVNIARDFHGEDIVLAEIGMGLRREGEQAELARLQKRFRLV